MEATIDQPRSWFWDLTEMVRIAPKFIHLGRFRNEFSAPNFKYSSESIRNSIEIRPFQLGLNFFSQFNPKTLTQMIYARPIFIDKVQPRPTSLEYDYRCSSPILQHRSHRVPAICCLPIRTFRNVIMVAIAVLFSYL